MNGAGGGSADFLRLSVPAKLIVGNRGQLKQRVLDELERGQKRFVLDFRETEYLDSSALGALVLVQKRIREQGGELRLANLNDDLLMLFELTKLDTLFRIDYDDPGGGAGGEALRSAIPPSTLRRAVGPEPPAPEP